MIKTRGKLRSWTESIEYRGHVREIFAFASSINQFPNMLKEEQEILQFNFFHEVKVCLISQIGYDLLK